MNKDEDRICIWKKFKFFGTTTIRQAFYKLDRYQEESHFIDEKTEDQSNVFGFVCLFLFVCFPYITQLDFVKDQDLCLHILCILFIGPQGSCYHPHLHPPTLHSHKNTNTYPGDSQKIYCLQMKHLTIKKRSNESRIIQADFKQSCVLSQVLYLLIEVSNLLNFCKPQFNQLEKIKL